MQLFFRLLICQLVPYPYYHHLVWCTLDFAWQPAYVDGCWQEYFVTPAVWMGLEKQQNKEPDAPQKMCFLKRPRRCGQGQIALSLVRAQKWELKRQATNGERRSEVHRGKSVCLNEGKWESLIQPLLCESGAFNSLGEHVSLTRRLLL